MKKDSPMKEELKACPWCDGAAVTKAYAGIIWGACLTCGGHGPAKKSNAEAITAWNTRAQPSPAGDVVERVAEAIKEAKDSFGYSIRMTRLVDGDATYELRYGDRQDVLEFSSHADAAEHVDRRRTKELARAALAASGAEVETWRPIETAPTKGKILVGDKDWWREIEDYDPATWVVQPRFWRSVSPPALPSRAGEK